jgi:predicted MFS family arabinose efflux permease
VSALGAGRIVAFYAAGIAVDRYGETRLLLIASLGAGTGVALATLWPYVGMLVCFAVAGVFIAAASPAGGKLVYGAVSARRRGLAMGLRQAGVPLGGLIAAVILPVVGSSFGWRPAVLVAGGVCAAGGAIAVLVAGLGRREADDGGRRSRHAGLRSFVGREYALVTVWGCLLVSGQYALLTFFALDTQARTGISTAAAAAAVVAIQLGGVFGRVGWGVALDRRMPHEKNRALLVLTILGTAAAAALALPFSNLVLLLVLGLVAGLTINGWQGVWTARIAELAGLRRACSATGFALTFIGVSITLATPLYGVVADTAGSYRSIWIALAVALAFAAAVISLVPVTAPHEARAT